MNDNKGQKLKNNFMPSPNSSWAIKDDANTPFTRYNQYVKPVLQPVVTVVNKHPTGCQPGCQTGCTTRFDNPFDNRLYTGTTGCQTGLTTVLTTGCIV